MISKHFIHCCLFVCTFVFLFTSSQAQNKKTNKIDSLDIGSRFIASGFMGDGEQGTEYIEIIKACRENPHSKPFCFKISYKKFGKDNWGGIYWQNEPDNWGNSPGEDFSKRGFKFITFWARGENGEEIVEFKVGGINTQGKKYRDSFKATIGEVILGKEWKKYRISLADKDLSSVIGGFCWVANKPGNPQGLTFYLDDILFVSDDPEK